MAVDICVGVTAGDIITKLQKKSRLNQDVIRKRFSSSSLLSSGSPTILDSPVEDNDHRLRLPEDMGPDAGQQFLYEVGGNIGMWYKVAIISLFLEVPLCVLTTFLHPIQLCIQTLGHPEVL